MTAIAQIYAAVGCAAFVIATVVLFLNSRIERRIDSTLKRAEQVSARTHEVLSKAGLL